MQLHMRSDVCLCCYAGVTILLSLTVFSLMIYDTLPESSDAVPVLG